MKKRIFENPEIGDRLTFLKTSEETGGAYSLMRVDLSPHGGNPVHYHLSFSEEFRVISGELCVTVNGEKKVVKKGQAVCIQPMESHRFFSESDQPTSFLVEIRPGKPDFEWSLATAYSLAAAGKCLPYGVPKNPMHLALLFEASESYSPVVPLFVQRQFFKMLAVIARRLGIERTLKSYCE